MEAVTKRELNQHTADVLARVTEAEDIVITERGTPRWRVTAIREDETVLGRLEREGRYMPPASTPVPWPAQPSGRRYGDAEVDVLLDELRGEH